MCVVAQLRFSSGSFLYAQRLAASALCNLSANHDENKKMSRAAGLVDALINLLIKSTDDTVQVILSAFLHSKSYPSRFCAVFRHCLPLAIYSRRDSEMACVRARTHKCRAQLLAVCTIW